MAPVSVSLVTQDQHAELVRPQQHSSQLIRSTYCHISIFPCFLSRAPHINVSKEKKENVTLKLLRATVAFFLFYPSARPYFQPFFRVVFSSLELVCKISEDIVNIKTSGDYFTFCSSVCKHCVSSIHLSLFGRAKKACLLKFLSVPVVSLGIVGREAISANARKQPAGLAEICTRVSTRQTFPRACLMVSPLQSTFSSFRYVCRTLFRLS